MLNAISESICVIIHPQTEV